MSPFQFQLIKSAPNAASIYPNASNSVAAASVLELTVREIERRVSGGYGRRRSDRQLPVTQFSLHATFDFFKFGCAARAVLRATESRAAKLPSIAIGAQGLTSNAALNQFRRNLQLRLPDNDAWRTAVTRP